MKNLQKEKNSFQLNLSKKNLAQTVNPPVNTLQYVSKHRDKNNIAHVRMQQRYLGFMVLGGYALLHSGGRVQELMSYDKVK